MEPLKSIFEKVLALHPFCVLLFGRLQVPVPNKKHQAIFNKVPAWSLYATSLSTGFRDHRLFKDVSTFCMFLSYPQSRQTLIGALLDAHPHMIVSHEADALGLLEAGFTKTQIFSYLLENSRAFAKTGRGWSGYSYELPDQWQGRFSALKVIGDKKGAGSLLRLHKSPELLGRFKKTIGIPIKFIHYLRNPYDNITSMCLRTQVKKYPSREMIDYYFSFSSAYKDIRSQIPPEDILEIRHEVLVQDPKRHLRQLCHFLNVEVFEDYLQDAARLATRYPHRKRDQLEWDESMIALVKEKMEPFEYLKGYSHED